MKIALSTDSAASLTLEKQKAFNVSVLPYTVILGEEEIKDGDRTIDELYDFVAKTGKLPRTSAQNVDELAEYFAGLLEGNDALIHICLSSGLTSTVEHAIEAASRFTEKPVYVIDSLVLSTGMALLVGYAHELIEQGLDAETVVEKVKARIPAVQVSFIIETLEYLKKGGRCSALTAFAANLIGIKPEIVMKEGKLHSGAKHRGPMKKVVKEYIEHTLEEYPNFDPSLCYVTYSTCPDDVLEMAVQMVKDAGFKKVETASAGSTIGTHCGPHTLGILFFADGPKAE